MQGGIQLIGSSWGTDEHTRLLIRWRVAHEALITGEQNTAIKGFESFVEEQSLQGRVMTGVSTEDGEPTAASWKWYTAMDEAIGGRPLRGRRGCGEKWRKTRTEENGRDKREERQEREARIASIPEDSHACRWVKAASIHRAVPQHPGIMHRPRISHKDIKEFPPLISDGLELRYGKDSSFLRS
ncbi:hypothetical protein F2P79_024843 [Pimephales promelas]|nr:hypothetical protein F2P79_024843 [Pimephales promelas]